MVACDLRQRIVELIGADLQESHHLGREVVLERIGEKCVDDGLDIEMKHPVGKRGAHVMADGAVETCVAGRDHLPAIRQVVLAHPAVEDQRVGGNLQALICRRQFVEKQNALGLIRRGQELGREPHRAAKFIVRIDADDDRTRRYSRRHLCGR